LSLLFVLLVLTVVLVTGGSLFYVSMTSEFSRKDAPAAATKPPAANPGTAAPRAIPVPPTTPAVPSPGATPAQPPRAIPVPR
jgi:zona occludens toxin (predicted ATPase)